MRSLELKGWLEHVSFSGKRNLSHFFASERFESELNAILCKNSCNFFGRPVALTLILNVIYCQISWR